MIGFGSDLGIAQTAELRAKTILFVTLSGRQGGGSETVAASARYVRLAAGATWVCAERGRDAYVPAFSKLNVTDTAVR